VGFSQRTGFALPAIAFDERQGFAVRRQALQNLSAWTQFMTEAERDQVNSKVPARLLASASKSESELLEEIFHDEN
jgi:hypothetical protein